MKQLFSPWRAALYAAAACCALTLCAPHASARQKMRPEEVVARHLESIGPAETRQSVTSRIINGDVAVTFATQGTGQLGGRAVIASSGNMYAVGMVFDNVNNYPHEKFGYDGKEVTSSYIRPGARSPLGDFLLTHRAVVKQGLLAGALSSAWPLYHTPDGSAKLEYGGLKKVGDRQSHEIRYVPKGGSDLKVSLFFDAETFRHLRTVYSRVIGAQMGSSPEASASQMESRYRLVEDFSDFRKESGLTLPHAYSFKLELRSRGGSFDGNWEMKLSQFSFNQRIDPAAFDVDEK